MITYQYNKKYKTSNLFLFSYLYLAKKSVTSLLSLLLPSCMVAPIKELANTLFSTFIKVLSTNSMAQITFNIDINIDFDISRRKSVFSSNKSSRESFIHSATSSVPYYKGMEIQSNNSL